MNKLKKFTDLHEEIGEILLNNGIEFTKKKEDKFDPNLGGVERKPKSFFTVVFKNYLIGYSQMIKNHLDPDSTNRKYEQNIILCEKILKQAKRNKFLNELV
jgi:hypothetical protein